MNARRAALDHVAVRTYLRIDAASNDQAFKVTIGVSQLDLLVEAIERDVGDAIRAAADACADRLRERGYPVTAAEILGSLEVADHAGGPTPPAGMS